MSDLGDAYKKMRGRQTKGPKTVTEWKEHLFPNMQAELENKREIIEQKIEKNRELQTRCDRLEAKNHEHNARRISTDRDCERLRQIIDKYRAYVPSGTVESIEEFVDDSLRAKYGEEAGR